jgi:hypothetical protein
LWAKWASGSVPPVWWHMPESKPNMPADLHWEWPWILCLRAQLCAQQLWQMHSQERMPVSAGRG